MKPALVAFIFLLAASTAFSLWNETLSLSIIDLNGHPIEGAQFSVIYQKLTSLSDDDGLLIGTSDQNGTFIASLENKVHNASESRKIKVTASADYWTGETRNYDLDGSEPLNFTFIVPIEQEPVYIEVLTSSHAPAAGASLLVFAGSTLRRTTASLGEAVIWLPQNTSFTGIAHYRNFSAQFTSEGIDASGGMKTISVVLPETPQAVEAPGTPVDGQGQAESAMSFTLHLANGSLAPNYPLNFTFGGQHYQLQTDSNGVASILLNGTGTLDISVASNEHVYPYQFSVPGPSSQSIALYPLLAINSFTYAPDGGDCYKLTANITDPRISLPLEVSMARYTDTANFTLPVTGEAGSLFSSRMCIKSETRVAVRASNKYEAAGAIVLVKPSSELLGPLAPFPFDNPGTPAVPQEKKPSQLAPETYLLPALLIGLLAALVLAFLFARRYVYRIPRFIAEYLHNVMRNMQRSRKPGLPPMPPLGGSSPPAYPPEGTPPSE